MGYSRKLVSALALFALFNIANVQVIGDFSSHFKNVSVKVAQSLVSKSPIVPEFFEKSQNGRRQHGAHNGKEQSQPAPHLWLATGMLDILSVVMLHAYHVTTHAQQQSSVLLRLLPPGSELVGMPVFCHSLFCTHTTSPHTHSSSHHLFCDLLFCTHTTSPHTHSRSHTLIMRLSSPRLGTCRRMRTRRTGCRVPGRTAPTRRCVFSPATSPPVTSAPRTCPTSSGPTRRATVSLSSRLSEYSGTLQRVKRSGAALRVSGRFW